MSLVKMVAVVWVLALCLVTVLQIVDHAQQQKPSPAISNQHEGGR